MSYLHRAAGRGRGFPVCVTCPQVTPETPVRRFGRPPWGAVRKTAPRNYARSDRRVSEQARTSRLSLGLFERVAATLVARRTSRTAPERLPELDDPFLLRGFLKCAACGRAMIPAANVTMRRLHDETPRYYRCRTLGCGGAALDAREVEGRLADFLGRLPEQFSEGHRKQGRIYATAWAFLSRASQRHSVRLMFAQLTWEPRRGAFAATQSTIDWDAEIARRERDRPPEPPEPPRPARRARKGRPTRPLKVERNAFPAAGSGALRVRDLLAMVEQVEPERARPR